MMYASQDIGLLLSNQRVQPSQDEGEGQCLPGYKATKFMPLMIQRPVPGYWIPSDDRYSIEM
jgi:hypothetical protein